MVVKPRTSQQEAHRPPLAAQPHLIGVLRELSHQVRGDVAAKGLTDLPPAPLLGGEAGIDEGEVENHQHQQGKDGSIRYACCVKA